jgi:LmbE family N-acetylglucosaminyl deacetylase
MPFLVYLKLLQTKYKTMQKRNSFLLLLLFIVQINFAQQPIKPNAVDIYNQIQKLNFLGSVLYIAAHPDDENTRLISFLSNDTKAQTGYMSLTRGDGGQNLIGPELRELLGTIRTQELIEARKIDGGEQFFSRANDFGYSKNPDETLNIWNKDQVLSDVVWVIRKFQPDVIINRFDHRTPGTTHGHHTSSALLSVAAFDKANDPSAYSNQLGYVTPWQPKRMYFNTSWWFYGSKEKFEKADKTNLTSINTGVYYTSLGKSNQEIAALSRSRHQSQGFGSTGTRGEDLEYLEFIKGENTTQKSTIFDGIDTTWNRIKGGKAIGEILQRVEKDFDFKNPAASIPELVKAYIALQNLEETHWKTIKKEAIKNTIASCAGLYLEAVAEKQEATRGSLVTIKAEAINRSAVEMKLFQLNLLPENKIVPQNLDLKNNSNQSISFSMQIPENCDYTEPYWLKNQGTLGMYRVDEQLNIGKPDIIRVLKVVFNIEINHVLIPFERTIIYKYNDDVKGEVYMPFTIIPIVSTAFIDKVKLFNANETKTVAVKITAGKDGVQGDIHLDVPENWKVTPKSIPFVLDKKDAVTTVSFEITPPKSASEIDAKAVVTIDGTVYDKEKININYNHITAQEVLKPAVSKFMKLDIKMGGEKIAYIMGAGDEMPSYLQQMGYSVTVLKPEAISKENLTPYNVVIMGIRAYNVVNALAFKQTLLFDFVKEGHTMIVQYNTLDDLVVKELAPFPLKISRDRVTEEEASIAFLAPTHPVLNYPNKITTDDFKGWFQEQGLYYPDTWDDAFTPILSSNDKGETAKKGALLIANYGKGHYIYTGLSFFRELPAGVEGAYRLFANMIAIGSKNKEK